MPRAQERNGKSRAAWGTISREQVVDAAVRALRDTDVEHLTIRGLARDLGVAPMSLYRHVESKDDLLDAVTGHLLADVWRPVTAETEGRAWLVAAADLLRQFLLDQPAALHAYLRHPVTSPAAIERMDTMLRVLRQHVVPPTMTDPGDSERRTHHAYAAIQTYTIGFAAVESARADWQPPAGAPPIAARLAAFTTPQAFREGLDFLLDGIEQPHLRSTH